MSTHTTDTVQERIAEYLRDCPQNTLAHHAGEICKLMVPAIAEVVAENTDLKAVIDSFDSKACDVHLTTVDLEQERDDLKAKLEACEKDRDLWKEGCERNNRIYMDAVRAQDNQRLEILDLQAKLEAAESILDGRLGIGNPNAILIACQEYVAAEDELPEWCDSEDYELSVAVRSVVSKLDEMQKENEQLKKACVEVIEMLELTQSPIAVERAVVRLSALVKERK